MSEQPARPFFVVERPMKYALLLGVLYLMPIVNTWLMYGGRITGEDVQLSALASLLLINPLATLIAGGVYAWRHGFHALLPWLFGLVFLPAAFVVYNDSALPYALGYTLVGYLGQLVALGIRRLLGRTATAGHDPTATETGTKG